MNEKTNIGNLVLGIASSSFVVGTLLGGVIGYDVSKSDCADSTEDTQRKTRLLHSSEYNLFLEQLPNYYAGGGYEGFDTDWAIADIDSFYKLGKEYSKILENQQKK
ncbi:MAG: hypothetical protein ACP5NV_06505 [Candidatus Woesearchaeota archaeon]